MIAAPTVKFPVHVTMANAPHQHCPLKQRSPNKVTMQTLSRQVTEEDKRDVREALRELQDSKAGKAYLR